MNEKIKEFAEQAWPGLPSHWWDRRDGEVAEAVNKFAELIVKECAQDFDKTYMVGGETMGNYIRRKFGVAE